MKVMRNKGKTVRKKIIIFFVTNTFRTRLFRKRIGYRVYTVIKHTLLELKPRKLPLTNTCKMNI